MKYGRQVVSLRIVVCVKYVPDATGDRRFAEDFTTDRDGVDGLLSELDEYGVEQALRIAEASGDAEVTVVTVGPDDAKDALRKALSMGADRAVHVNDDDLHGSDALATSLVLAKAVERTGFDLVVCGMASTDGTMGVVPALLAERLGVPQVTLLSEVSVEAGVVTGRRKARHRDRIVASYCLGTRRLYDLIDENPRFEFLPIDQVCHPGEVSRQSRMVSITQAFAIDLTGQVCVDQFEGEFYGGVSTQAAFMRGAARSPGGKPIVCLSSTTDDGRSRIKPLLEAGDGVGIARSDVHYVITEYGIAYLFGKSIRERAVALIEVAHPRWREELLTAAKKLDYVRPDQYLASQAAYSVGEERIVTLKSGLKVMIRPARAADAGALQGLFHRLSEDDVYTRFFRRVRSLSYRELQTLCNVNHETDVAFLAVTGPRENEEVIGSACYFLSPATNLAEVAFMVAPEFQGAGLGTALQARLQEYAMSCGLRGFVSQIMPRNTSMLRLAARAQGTMTTSRDEDAVHVTVLFPSRSSTSDATRNAQRDSASVETSQYTDTHLPSGQDLQGN